MLRIPERGRGESFAEWAHGSATRSTLTGTSSTRCRSSTTGSGGSLISWCAVETPEARIGSYEPVDAKLARESQARSRTAAVLLRRGHRSAHRFAHRAQMHLWLGSGRSRDAGGTGVPPVLAAAAHAIGPPA